MRERERETETWMQEEREKEVKGGKMIRRRKNTSHGWIPHPFRTQLSSEYMFLGYTAKDQKEARSHSLFTLTYNSNKLGNPFSKNPQQRGSSK